MKPLIILLLIVLLGCSKASPDESKKDIKVTCKVTTEYRGNDIYTFYYVANCMLSQPISEDCIVGYRWYLQDTNHVIIDSAFWSTTIPKGSASQTTHTGIKAEGSYSKFKIVSVQPVSDKYNFIF